MAQCTDTVPTVAPSSLNWAPEQLKKYELITELAAESPKCLSVSVDMVDGKSIININVLDREHKEAWSNWIDYMMAKLES